MEWQLLKGCIGLCLLLTSHGAASEGSHPIAQYVRALESSYRDVKTLRADFTQTYVWGGRTRVESGTVYFARGGLMRWDYRVPKPKLFLSNRKELILYVPDEKQVTRSPVKSSEDVRVPFRLLLSRFDLSKIFSKIEFSEEAPKFQSQDRVLRAVPRRGQEEAYTEILIQVTPEFDIRRLVVSYPDQSRMEFSFDHTERNVRLSPDLFRFEPPPGTEVIKQP